MKFSSISIISAFAISLSACGAPITEETEVEETETVDVSGDAQADYETHNAILDNVIAIDVISPIGDANANARNDTVELNGIYGIDAEALLGEDAILGQMSMTADFGNDTVSGELTNSVVAYDNDNGAHAGGSVSPLDGTIAYSGIIDDDSLESEVNGSLTTQDGIVYTFDADIAGGFYTIIDPATSEMTAVGNFSGNVVQTGVATIYDITDTYDFDGDGTADTGFVLCENTCALE